MAKDFYNGLPTIPYFLSYRLEREGIDKPPQYKKVSERKE